MRTRTQSLIAVLLLLAATLFSQAGTAHAAGTSVPFNMTWSGTANIKSGKFLFAGTGTADAMGPVSAHGTATITGLPFKCAGFVNVYVQTIEAADGTLTITSNDVGCITGIGTFHGHGTWTVTSGTGRYAGAAGSGSIEGLANFFAHTTTQIAHGYLVL